MAVDAGHSIGNIYSFSDEKLHELILKKEKQSNADKMMHSPSMAEKYRRMVYIE